MVKIYCESYFSLNFKNTNVQVGGKHHKELSASSSGSTPVTYPLSLALFSINPPLLFDECIVF